MYLSKKKTLRILAYCATSAIFFSGFTNVASAEDDLGNTVNISNETVTSDIAGGDTSSGDASNNTVNISGDGTSINNSYTRGGHVTGSGNASDNVINIFGGTINSHIHVGDVRTGNASGNALNIHGGNFTGGWISGAYIGSGGTASNNVVNIYGGDFNIGFIEGSWGSGTHTGNKVNIFGGNIHGGIISGAWVGSNTTATGNEVNISGGTIDGNPTIAGAYMTSSGNARGNTTSISGGTVTGSVQGGYVSGSGDASGNRVNISGGKITGEILGGYVGSGTVTNNSINISGNPDLSGASLYAGRIGNNTDLYGSGNSLNFFSKNITAQNIGGFDTLNFYLPSNTQNGDTILTLTDGATDLSKTTVNLNAFGGNIHTGDTINLLTNQNGITVSDVQNDGTIAQGISLEYELTNLGLNADGTAYTATVGERIGTGLKDQTKALTSAVVDTASLMDSGTDRLMEWLPESFEMTTGTGGTDLNSVPTTGFDPFAGIGGSVVKIKTGDGSSLKSKNGGLNVGMARYLKNRHGAFVFGPVTDYGQDHYESTMEDGTKGSGNSKYFTAGIIARQMNYGGMYYEASARYGRIQTNFVSDNFLVHNVPTHAYYDSSAPCYAGHVRVGWRNNVSNESILDAYGVYSLNRVSGMTAEVSTGETYTFSGVNSGRMRLGARLTRTIRDNKRFYSGIAFVHEFTSETRGTYMGMDTKKSSLRGSYGIIELGWQTKPSKNSPILIDTSLVGVMGDHKGLTVSAKFKKDF